MGKDRVSEEPKPGYPKPSPVSETKTDPKTWVFSWHQEAWNVDECTKTHSSLSLFLFSGWLGIRNCCSLQCMHHHHACSALLTSNFFLYKCVWNFQVEHIKHLWRRGIIITCGTLQQPLKIGCSVIQAILLATYTYLLLPFLMWVFCFPPYSYGGRLGCTY